jgi:hypothetical protein
MHLVTLAREVCMLSSVSGCVQTVPVAIDGKEGTRKVIMTKERCDDEGDRVHPDWIIGLETHQKIMLQ